MLCVTSSSSGPRLSPVTECVGLRSVRRYDRASISFGNCYFKGGALPHAGLFIGGAGAPARQSVTRFGIAPSYNVRSGSNKGSLNTISSAGEPGMERNPRTSVCPKPAVFWQEHLQRAGMFLAPLRSAARIVSTTPITPPQVAGPCLSVISAVNFIGLILLERSAVLKTDLLFNACSRCSAWPMSANIAESKWGSQKISFRCSRCGHQEAVVTKRRSLRSDEPARPLTGAAAFKRDLPR